MEINIQNKGEITILKDIILPLQSSKVIFITGQADSGKTAMLETIKRYIDKKDISNFLIKQQDDFHNETVIEEIKTNQTKKEINRIISSLKIAELEQKYLNKKINTLSTSERQKLKLAKALYLNPHIILIDDIFSSFDQTTTNKLVKLIKMMKNRYKKTIIIATTNSEIIHQLADEVFLIDKGVIIFKGNKYELFENEKLIKKYGIRCPEVMEISNIIKKEKNVEIGYRDNINDLIKDIYRYIR